MSSTKSELLLPKPAVYFPVSEDRYSARAGLSKFGYDFGNPQHDQKLFQFDNTFHHYQENKLNIRKDSIQDYVCADTANAASIDTAADFILHHLCHEHPNYFNLQLTPQGSVLNCDLTNEQIQLDHNSHLLTKNQPQFENLFDALALQVQEDICIMQITNSTATMIAAHLCAPNHWSAAEKLNLDMAALHQHVPDFANDNRGPNQLIVGLHHKVQAYVRFAWGLSEQPQLNQHPNIRCTVENQANKDLWMRIERQVIWPIANTDLVLFTIRTYFRHCATLEKQQRLSLMNAVNSMSDATLEYKNINKADVLERLNKEIASHCSQ